MLIFLVILLMFSTPQVHMYDGPGPRILIVSGTHGDEPGTSFELDHLVADNFFRGWNAVVVPNLNPVGRATNTRSNWMGLDINRGYDSSKPSLLRRLVSPENVLIERLMDSADMILDFHEANYFHLLESRSMGNTISGTLDNETCDSLAEALVREINGTISNTDNWYSVLRRDPCTVAGSLQCAAGNKGKKYLLFEVCRGNRTGKPLQSIDERRRQTRHLLSGVRSQLSSV